MRKLKPVILILFAFLSAFDVFSQSGSNYYGDNTNNNNRNNNNNGRRFNRRCNEPFPMRSFNRDYAGVSSSNYYHLDKTLKEYTRLRCLTAEQIRRLALLYPTDRDKYEYLTYSLTHVFDIENYALAGAVLANRNARDAFYRFLVREGVPAGDYFADPYMAQNGYFNPGYVMPVPPPQYIDRYGNAYNSAPNRNGYDNRNDPYNNYGQGGNLNNNYDNNTNNPSNNGANNQYGINSGFRGLMTYKEFEVLKERVKQNTFDKGKLDSAKSILRENTLTANQISEIARLFNYDSNRLELGKFAFDFAYDKENYAAVIDAMAFEVNKKDLQRYIENRRK